VTISEVLRDLQDISSQTKVPVSILQSSLSGNQHLSVLLDSYGFIGPNGNGIDVKSTAPYAPTGTKSACRGQAEAFADLAASVSTLCLPMRLVIAAIPAIPATC
jgi:hypothetical protein